jgi:hypothetical protein
MGAGRPYVAILNYTGIRTAGIGNSIAVPSNLGYARSPAGGRSLLLIWDYTINVARVRNAVTLSKPDVLAGPLNFASPFVQSAFSLS